MYIFNVVKSEPGPEFVSTFSIASSEGPVIIIILSAAGRLTGGQPHLIRKAS
jgi:hypothetical protein